MRAVLDTNILISALISPSGHAAAIYDAWEDGRFILVSCADHLEEIRATLQKPRVAALIEPHKAGRLVNQIRRLSVQIGTLPRVRRSPEATDDYLLALSELGQADYLVTGDKTGLLLLRRHKATQIITAAEFIRVLR